MPILSSFPPKNVSFAHSSEWAVFDGALKCRHIDIAHFYYYLVIEEHARHKFLIYLVANATWVVMLQLWASLAQISLRQPELYPPHCTRQCLTTLGIGIYGFLFDSLHGVPEQVHWLKGKGFGSFHNWTLWVPCPLKSFLYVSKSYNTLAVLPYHKILIIVVGVGHQGFFVLSCFNIYTDFMIKRDRH